MASFGSGYPSPACGKSIWVEYNGKRVSATIQDTCPTCPQGGLDLSMGLFSALASQDLGVIQASWGYNGGGGGSSAPETTKEAWVAPTTTKQAWVAPTTTTAPAWTPEATTAAAPVTTTAAVVQQEEKKVAAPTTTTTADAWSAPAAAPTSVPAASPSSFESSKWVAAAPAVCPNTTLILFDNEDVLFNGTYTAQLNGTNTLFGNASAMVVNALLPNTTAYCFNSTFSLYNASTFNLTQEENTNSNSSSLFSIFAIAAHKA